MLFVVGWWRRLWTGAGRENGWNCDGMDDLFYWVLNKESFGVELSAGSRDATKWRVA